METIGPQGIVPVQSQERTEYECHPTVSARHQCGSRMNQPAKLIMIPDVHTLHSVVILWNESSFAPF